MFVFRRFISFSARYIIWLGFATLLFAPMGVIAVRGQTVDMGAARDRDIGSLRSSVLSQEAGRPAQEGVGLRSSIDDRANSDRRSTLSGDDGRRPDDEDDDDGNDNSDDEETADDRDPSDRGFRGESDVSGRQRLLDGDLRAQYEAAQRRREPPQDGDYGALIAGSDAGSRDNSLGNPDGQEQDGFIETTDGEVLLQAANGRLVQSPSGRFARPLDGGAQPGLQFEALGEDPDQTTPDPTTARDMTLSPYTPVGIGVGSFRVFPEVALSQLFTDNVRRTSGPKDADVALELRPSIRARSNWRRHALEAYVQGRRSFYREFDTEDAREILSNLRGRIDITRRTNIESEANYALQQESRGVANAPGNALERPDVHSTRGALVLNHRFNRLSIRLRGEVSTAKYDSARLVGGGVNDQSDRDNRDNTVTFRGGYEFNPGLSVFAEGLVERVDFKRASDTDGILRDSRGYGLRTGILFDNGSKLYGEVALGFRRLTPDDNALSDVDGVTFDANVIWRPTELTTFSFEASTNIDASTVAGSGGVLIRAANLRVQHELRQHFILNAGIGVNQADYVGSSLIDRSYTGQLGAEYIFSREVALIGIYEYRIFDSSAQNRDYTSNRLRLGMRVRR